MNYFVYVVCGDKKYIDTLHFSLKFLKHYSENSILVITDSSRNEIPIVHDNVINIKTPKQYTNHQASIYLKTGIHRFVPNIETDKYAYIDTDIIPISKSCNNIFSYNPNPILFAKDHCKFDEFSPYAMNCSCKESFELQKIDFTKIMKSYFSDYVPDNEQIIVQRNRLNLLFKRQKKLSIRNIFSSIKYLANRYLSRKKNFQLSDFRFNKLNRCWYDSKNNMISFDYKFHEPIISKKIGIYFKNKNWYNREHKIISPQMPECKHLGMYIYEKYNIQIPENWRHWNGGVFLFNAGSISFLEDWHKTTLQEFESTELKTRDQGTLAITIWKHKLQNAETLPETYNFLADYKNSKIGWNPNTGYTNDGFLTNLNPSMIHIYHEWGNGNWDIWQSIIQIGLINGILE